MKDRILSLLGTINKGIYEKETELSLSLMAALAGDSVILLGPPGVAKSMVARRLKLAFKDARSFEYLMSRFSTPDEIFGPVSISKLKDADKYECNTRVICQRLTWCSSTRYGRPGLPYRTRS